MRLEHIGIAVRDLEESETLFETLFQAGVYKREKVESESVITSFIRLSNVKIELLSAIDGEGPIARFIEKKGPGIHHLAFEVEDIESEAERLAAAGFSLVDPVPRPGADNKKIIFLHPSSTQKTLIELCQEIRSSDPH